MTERRVLVCGGRTFDDVELLNSTLDALHKARPIDLIIHGDCTGADLMAEGWASSLCVSVDAFPANWQDQGKAAGPIRNERMIREGKPTLVIAFPGGIGTEDMVRKAEDHGIPVRRIER